MPRGPICSGRTATNRISAPPANYLEQGQACSHTNSLLVRSRALLVRQKEECPVVRSVLDGLLRIGFLHHQQIIWNKGRPVLTRTLYWFAHEPCWFVRKKNAPWSDLFWTDCYE